MTSARFGPAKRLRGAITPPPDRAITHRAVLLGAMAAEPVRVRNVLHAADTAAALEAMRTLGALITVNDAEVVIRGTGLREPLDCHEPIGVGTAATLLHLLPGWLAGQAGRSYAVDGDAALREQPVEPIGAPLRRMGARVEATAGDRPPVTVHGGRLRGAEHALAAPSPLVKGCVLLAGLVADGITTVAEPAPSCDHTERLLAAAGVTVARDGGRVTVHNVDELVLGEVVVPGDASTAAYLVAAAVLVPGSRIEVRGVGTNWTRTAFLRVLEHMGGIVVGERERAPAPGDGVPAHEPAGDLDVAHGPLVGADVDAGEAALLAGELPLVALLGCFAEGDTILRVGPGAAAALAPVVHALRGLGGQLDAAPDGLVVRGTAGLRGGTVDAGGDHRLALLGAVAGLASREGVRVSGIEAADAAHPGLRTALTVLPRSRA